MSAAPSLPPEPGPAFTREQLQVLWKRLASIEAGGGLSMSMVMHLQRLDELTRPRPDSELPWWNRESE
jgi:hypothetical protein